MRFLQSVACEEDSTEMIQWSSFEVRDLAVIVNAEMLSLRTVRRLYSLPQVGVSGDLAYACRPGE